MSKISSSEIQLSSSLSANAVSFGLYSGMITGSGRNFTRCTALFASGFDSGGFEFGNLSANAVSFGLYFGMITGSGRNFT